MVLAFYSNQQSFDTIEEFKESLGDITDTAVGYVDNTLNVCALVIMYLYKLYTCMCARASWLKW